MRKKEKEIFHYNKKLILIRMYHNDLQIHVSNNSKRNINEHPIDRILTGVFNTNNQMKNSQLNTKSNNYKSDTKFIIQRQRNLRAFLNKQDDFEVGTDVI